MTLPTGGVPMLTWRLKEGEIGKVMKVDLRMILGDLRHLDRARSERGLG